MSISEVHALSLPDCAYRVHAQVSMLEKSKQEALEDAKVAMQREARAVQAAEASALQIEQLEAQVDLSVPCVGCLLF